MADDFTANINTSGRVLVSGPAVTGTIDTSGDHDWFQVWLWAGHTYAIKEDGSAVNSGNTLDDTIVALHNSAGVLLATNDDGGVGDSSYLRYEAPTSGFYYVDAGAHTGDTGAYQIHVDQQADKFSASETWGAGIASAATSVFHLADFNLDGRDDLLQISASGVVSIAIANSDGSGFGALHQVATGATQSDQIGNFDNFASPDILQRYGGQIEVAAWDQSTEQFAPFNAANPGPPTRDNPGFILPNISHADINADGQQDLIQVTDKGVVQVAFSNTVDRPVGEESFLPFVNSNIGATTSDQISSGHNPSNTPDVARSDFNGDGTPDLLQLYNGRAYVALSQPDGHFGAFTVWSGSDGTSSDKFADFNGDGKADLYQYYNGTAYVALSNGSSFGNWQQFATGASATDQIADMNGDNRADLYQVYQGRAYIALSSGSDGDPTHVSSTHYDVWATSGVSSSDFLADVNGDGLTDVIHVSSGGVTVLESQHVAGSDQYLFIV